MSAIPREEVATVASVSICRAKVRPAAPVPPAAPLRFLAAIRAARANPITAFAREAYEKPFLKVGRGGRLALVNDPAGIERVLVRNAGAYRKSVLQQRRLRPALGDGLLTAEGETWRATRRIAAPLFSPKLVAGLFDDMRQAAEALCERWAEAGRPAELDLAAEFQRLTYEIVARTVFSGALAADRARVHALMAVYFDTVGRVDLASMYALPNWWPSLAEIRSRRTRRELRAIVAAAVAARLDDTGREAVDLLDRLIHTTDPASGRGLDRQGVVDNVLTFLAAGHETTGNALSWTLYLLGLHPEAAEAARQEIDAVLAGGPIAPERLADLRFTRAVVEEALRLYPPAPFIGRQAVADDLVAGHFIPKGAELLIAPWLVHRHRALWREPDRFRPERFLGAERAAIADGAYLPFGLGPRICIGQRFAMQEILTVLATVLARFRIDLVRPQTVFPLARITLTPAGGLPAHIRPR
ncbi:cytochrome P450 [Consotaella salsifontis]|uniref:Cytochrome P450 n=1 Tax=Consotaella salsifontis TaxID=1365950 RepID=A0A1T4TA24_9HYPH|nr:cytochrome P450 [Consotaella salsifontis]SKA37365.1 Cytochrome P450 [Consotaella salsifontis]